MISYGGLGTLTRVWQEQRIAQRPLFPTGVRVLPWGVMKRRLTRAAVCSGWCVWRCLGVADCVCCVARVCRVSVRVCACVWPRSLSFACSGFAARLPAVPSASLLFPDIISAAVPSRAVSSPFLAADDPRLLFTDDIDLPDASILPIAPAPAPLRLVYTKSLDGGAVAPAGVWTSELEMGLFADLPLDFPAPQAAASAAPSDSLPDSNTLPLSGWTESLLSLDDADFQLCAV